MDRRVKERIAKELKSLNVRAMKISESEQLWKLTSRWSYKAKSIFAVE
jgi:hypothetical protein